MTGFLIQQNKEFRRNKEIVENNVELKNLDWEVTVSLIEVEVRCMCLEFCSAQGKEKDFNLTTR